MKRFFFKVQGFRKFINSKIYSYLSKRFKTPERICKNQELLINGLKMCYTLSDIARLRELFDLYRNDFTTMEALRFNIEILYRKKIIKIMNKNYPIDQVYPTVHINRFFKNANYKQCDAIMLHINYNKEKYGNRPDGLRIFKEMWTRRKIQIVNSLPPYKTA